MIKITTYRYYPDTAFEGGLVRQGEVSFASADNAIEFIIQASNVGLLCSIERIK